MAGVHYIPMKGHLFLGVRAKVPSLLGWKRTGYDCVRPRGHAFSPLHMWQRGRETEIDGKESADINKLPCGEPEAALVLEGRSCTSSCWGFILHDSEVDIQRGICTLNTNVMLDIQPKASGFTALNSCTVKNSQQAWGGISWFFSFPVSLLPFRAQYLLLVELLSTWILSQQFSQGKKYSYLRMNYSSYPPPKGRNTIIDVHKGQEELIDRQRGTMKFRAPILVPVFFHLAAEDISEGLSAVNASR